MPTLQSRNWLRALMSRLGRSQALRQETASLFRRNYSSFGPSLRRRRKPADTITSQTEQLERRMLLAGDTYRSLVAATQAVVVDVNQPHAAQTDIVFFDSTLPDSAALYESIKASLSDDAKDHLIALDPNQDPLSQMSHALSHTTEDRKSVV